MKDVQMFRGGRILLPPYSCPIRIPVGGPLSSVLAEAAVLLSLLNSLCEQRLQAWSHTDSQRLTLFIDCLCQCACFNFFCRSWVGPTLTFCFR